MVKSKSRFSIFIPSATVFFSSGCIMILELVAGRLIARHLGSSLYTWTSVIGVVLAGIAIGNYLGGRIADRFKAGKALSVLFGLCSAACVLTIVLNNLVGEWVWLWKLSWSMRIFSHVSLVFLVPSTLLGTISPVVAKMALDQGLPTGLTVGDIYACGAAGSIAGTFLAGFYLIAAMGTIPIIWTIGVALLLMAILYRPKFWLLYIWAALFMLIMTMGIAPFDWSKNTGSFLGLRNKPDPGILYEDESQYSYIRVQQLSENPDYRIFVEDKLIHSEIIMGDIRNLKSFYEQVYAMVTHRLSREKNKLSTFSIGGGGYIIPRYIEDVWPGSNIDVAEIDPAVTAAAIQAFGLSKDSIINTLTMDARNYVDELLEKKRSGEFITQYDFIYEDAFSNYSIPYQLVTKQFNDKIFEILTDDGAYLINLIDAYTNGRFLAAVVNTLRQTFPNVYVLTKPAPTVTTVNFIIVATKQNVDLETPSPDEPAVSSGLRILNDSDIESSIEQIKKIVLTDDYAPVDNLLAPAVRDNAIYELVAEYLKRAKLLKEKGKWQQSIAKYKEAANATSSMTVIAYEGIAGVFAKQGKWEEAIRAGEKALEHNENALVKRDLPDLNKNLGVVLKSIGKTAKASAYLDKAIEGYQRNLAKTPDSVEIVYQLGDTFAETGNLIEATKYFRQALDMNPLDIKNHSTLAKILIVQKRYDEAAENLRNSIGFMREKAREKDAITLQRMLEFAESAKSKHKE